MNKVDEIINDRIFENNSNVKYIPRFEMPASTEKVDQSNMEENYQNYVNQRKTNDPIKSKSNNKKESINKQTNRRDDFLKKIKSVKDPFKLLGLDKKNDDLAAAKLAY